MHRLRYPIEWGYKRGAMGQTKILPLMHRGTDTDTDGPTLSPIISPLSVGAAPNGGT